MAKSVLVTREIQPLIDLKNLAIIDYVNSESDRNGALRCSGREAAQLLLNSLFSLAAENRNAVVELPGNEVIVIPRSKPLPEEKKPTKWEEFARKKGITKKKKTRFQYSEQFDEDRPTYGYGSAKNDPMNTWLVEVPDGADPMDDHITLAKEKTKETVKKNKKQQLKNQAGGNKQQMSQRKEELQSIIKTAKSSTASMGKFDKVLENEMVSSKGKKKSGFLNDKTEKEKTVKIAKKIVNDKSSVSVNKRKAAHLAQSNFKRSRK